jgi:hypothetical protein
VRGLLDRLAATSSRWKLPLSILSAAWLVVTIAAHARFITMPELKFLTGLPATIAASAWNGLWWGYLRPQLELRKATASTMEVQNG